MPYLPQQFQNRRPNNQFHNGNPQFRGRFNNYKQQNQHGYDNRQNYYSNYNRPPRSYDRRPNNYGAYPPADMYRDNHGDRRATQQQQKYQQQQQRTEYDRRPDFNRNTNPPRDQKYYHPKNLNYNDRQYFLDQQQINRNPFRSNLSDYQYRSRESVYRL